MSANNCVNCKWARWTMTTHKVPRINPKVYGNCVRPNKITVPLCDTLRINRVVIWADTPYVKCPVFANKETP